MESPVTAQFSVSKTETDTNILSDQIPDVGFRSPCVKGKTSSKVTTTPKRSLILEKAGRKEKGEEKIKQTDGKREEWKAATSQISTSSVDVSSFLLGLDELLPDVEDKKESCQGLFIVIYFIYFPIYSYLIRTVVRQNGKSLVNRTTVEGLGFELLIQD